MIKELLVVLNVALLVLNLCFMFKYILDRHKTSNRRLKMPLIVLLILISLFCVGASGVGTLKNEEGSLIIKSEEKKAIAKNDELKLKEIECRKEELNKDSRIKVAEGCIGYISLGIAFLIRKSIDEEKGNYKGQRWDWSKIKES